MRRVPAAFKKLAIVKDTGLSNEAYLESWTASQRAPQLHQCTRDLVAHGGVTLVVVYRSRRGMVAMGAGATRSSCRGSGSRCGSGSVTSGALWTKNSGLQTGLDAGSARGARGGSTAHRHVE